MTYAEDELFYEPPALYPEQNFEIDGIQVHFHYLIPTLPHFEYRGDISETGYRSDFVYKEWLDELGVEGLARERIKKFKIEFYLEQKQKQKKIKRGKKVLI